MNKDMDMKIVGVPGKKTQYQGSNYQSKVSVERWYSKYTKTNYFRWGSFLVFVLSVSLLAFLRAPKQPTLKSTINMPEDLKKTKVKIKDNYDFGSDIDKNQKGKKNIYRKVVHYDGPELVKRPSLEKIPPGLEGRAKLLSGASDSTVKAKLIQDLTLNGEVLASEGTVLMGLGKSGDSRLYIIFNQLVFKDGSVKSITAQAVEIGDKMVGLKGSRNGYYAKKLAAGTGLNFIGGLSEGLQEKEESGEHIVKKTNMRNALLYGAGNAALELSKETMAGLKNKAPSFKVPAGTEIVVIFSGK